MTPFITKLVKSSKFFFIRKIRGLKNQEPKITELYSDFIKEEESTKEVE